ncbi:MAG: cation:proton antiporter [Dehalococcoidia bacterium]
MVTPFAAAPHDDVLAFLVQVGILLLTARVLGTVAQRLGQPAVLGEILAGVILGPSLLAGFVPGVEEWVIPQTEPQGHLLEIVGLLGALFLLLLTGLETDLALIRHQARTAAAVAAGGLVLPFATGFGLGYVLPESLIGGETDRAVFAVFLGTALSISSIAVIGKVLIDMDLMRRDVGQTIIAAAVIDDTIGWVALAVVAGLASGAALTVGSLGEVFLSTIGFIAFSFILGRLLVRIVFRSLPNRPHEEHLVLSAVVVLMFAWAAISSALHLEAVLGAFVMGMLISQVGSLPASVRETLERVTVGVFAPIFFGVAGLKMDLTALAESEIALLTLVLLAVATFGKVFGAFAGARLAGVRDHWRALSFGAALNARAAMGIIIATVGLSLGIISQDLFSMLVLMSVVTAVGAPPSLRWAVARVELEPTEAARLAREALAGRSWILNLERVLMPVRYNPGRADAVRTMEAHVLERLAAGRRLSITLVTVVDAAQRDSARRYLDDVAASYAGHEVTRRVVTDGDVQEAILAEAERGHDLLLLGAPEAGRDDRSVYSPLLDAIVRLSPIATMIASGQDAPFDEHAKQHRIVVPTNGRRPATWAAETAFALARDDHAHVFVVHVTPEDRSMYAQTRGVAMRERQRVAGEQAVEELVALGARWGVSVSGHVLDGEDVAEAVALFRREREVDLVLVGTDIRAGSQHLALGRRVEELIAGAECPVIVVNSP